MNNIFACSKGSDLLRKSWPTAKMFSRLQNAIRRPGQTLKVLPKILVSILLSITFLSPTPAHANQFSDMESGTPQNLAKYNCGEIEKGDFSKSDSAGTNKINAGAISHITGCIALSITGVQDDTGKQLKSISLLPSQGKAIAMMFQNQPGTKEYFADLLNNIGLPTVSRAYAQGTGYSAMSSFLPFWKVFRNLAYSLYIIMFVVVGIMIMLRTKVNAQTIITIQTALPNLLITLLLITFSYAIVGLMIDLMYFLIYFVVYLLSSIDIISTPTTAITRLLSNSAWSVIFAGRNSIISAVSMAITQALSGLGTGVLGGAGAIASFVSWLGLGYLIVAVWLAVAMLKLMWVLMNCYFMLLVQTITAPIQILMNAVPGSKAFSEWLKKTASYLIPFPIVASMFIFAAVLIGDPSRATIVQGNIFGTDANPFGINQNADLYSNYGGRTQSGSVNTGTIWLPPFTLTDYAEEPASLMVLLGFFIITMTPAAAKMAMDALQVKVSPYTSEIGAGLGQAIQLAQQPAGYMKGIRHEREAQEQHIELVKAIKNKT